jgi:hypothetical protein
MIGVKSDEMQIYIIFGIFLIRCLSIFFTKKEKPGLRISLLLFLSEDSNYTRLSLILAFLPVSSRK